MSSYRPEDRRGRPSRSSMSVALHRCAATGCSSRIPFDRQLCADHWRAISDAHREAIRRAAATADGDTRGLTLAVAEAVASLPNKI